MIELAAAAAAKSTSAWDEPGTLGFLVVFGMAIILFFVFRSLSRHLRRINEAARAEAAAVAKAGPSEPGDDDPASPLASGTTIGPPAASRTRR